MAAVPSVKLASGQEMPCMAYGVGSVWMKSGSEINRDVVEGIKTALSLGYRHLDGAQCYNTEAELGLGISESGVPREEIFLTTKAYKLDDVVSSLKESLSKLKTSYVDLYLIHIPFLATSPAHLQSAWRGMEQCLSEGLARNIGVSNFAASHLQTVLEVATARPSVCQIERHPYLQQPDLLALFRKENIRVTAYSGLVPLTKAAGGPADAVCAELAEKHGVSVEAVLVRWGIETGDGVVTTSSKRERMERYIREVPGLRLSAEEVERISEASKGKHYRAYFGDEFAALEQKGGE